MTLVPGSRLGPYEITAALGEGGMGVVYSARDTRLGRTVAIKLLRPEAVDDPERTRRFLQEAAEGRFRTIVLLSGGLSGGAPARGGQHQLRPPRSSARPHGERAPRLHVLARSEPAASLPTARHSLGEQETRAVRQRSCVPSFTEVARDTIDWLDRFLGPVAPGRLRVQPGRCGEPGQLC